MAELLHNLSFKDYRALEGMSISTLKAMAESPKKYHYSLTAPRVETPAMALGTATHLAILEPHRMALEFAPVYPGAVRRGKEWDAHQALHEGKTILSQTELDQVVGMAASVADYAPAKKYLAKGEAEVSMQWRDLATGRTCRGRIDWLHVDGGRHIITDLKTTKDGTPKGFGTSAARYYLEQAAYYTDGYYEATGVMPEFKFLVVESSAPYECTLFNVPDGLIQRGRLSYQRLLAKLEDCETLDSWPSAVESEIDLELPRWAE